MRYTVYRYQADGFSHGWKEEQADTIPEGAVSVSVWDDKTHWGLSQADKEKVYIVDSQPAPVKGGK